MAHSNSRPTPSTPKHPDQWAGDDGLPIRTLAVHALGVDTVALTPSGNVPIHVPESLCPDGIPSCKLTLHQRGVFGDIAPLPASYHTPPQGRQAVVFWLDEAALGRYAGAPINDAAQQKLHDRAEDLTEALRRQNGLTEDELSFRLLVPNEAFRDVIGRRACAVVVLALDAAHANLLQEGIAEPLRHAQCAGLTAAMHLRHPLGNRLAKPPHEHEEDPATTSGSPPQTIVQGGASSSRALVPSPAARPASTGADYYHLSAAEAGVMRLADIMRQSVAKAELHPIMSNGKIVLVLHDREGRPRERNIMDVTPLLMQEGQPQARPSHLLSVWLNDEELELLHLELTTAMQEKDKDFAESLSEQIQDALRPIKDQLERKFQTSVQLVSKYTDNPEIPLLLLLYIDHPQQQDLLHEAADILDMARRYHGETDRQWKEKTRRKPDAPDTGTQR